jgi:FAD/FMN-containing dehydrogenase
LEIKRDDREKAMTIKEALTGVLGPESIITDSETLEKFSRDFSFARPFRPRVIVRPGTIDEVQKIVSWANRTATPLVPVSSGPPHFHGDTVPGVPGAAIVDLGGMKRIIRVDRRNRVAMIEAGVTFSQLQPELAREGLRLSTPLMPRANKSVVASLLEREPNMVPRLQWASLDPLRCTSIIFGDGQKLTTGDAGNWTSMEGAWEKKQAAVSATGPGQTDFYRLVSGAQGSLGIVTWASVRCEVLPEFHKMFFVPARKLDDLVGFTYRLLRFRFGDELLVMNNTSLSFVLGGGTDRIKKLIHELPPWVVLVGIAGRSLMAKEKVEYQEKDISDIAQKFGLQLLPAVPGASNVDAMKAILNPSPEPYWRLAYKGGFQDILFLTTLNRTPEFVGVMNTAAEAGGYPVPDIGVYIQPLQQGANCHCEFILPFDKDNPEETAGVERLFTLASEEMLKTGAFFSRPYGIWAAMAYNRDAQTRTVLRKLKGIFDPNNVMNPGKLCF